jgi:hypothetical protein
MVLVFAEALSSVIETPYPKYPNLQTQLLKVLAITAPLWEEGILQKLRTLF